MDGVSSSGPGGRWGFLCLNVEIFNDRVQSKSEAPSACGTFPRERGKVGR